MKYNQKSKAKSAGAVQAHHAGDFFGGEQDLAFHVRNWRSKMNSAVGESLDRRSDELGFFFFLFLSGDLLALVDDLFDSASGSSGQRRRVQISFNKADEGWSVEFFKIHFCFVFNFNF